MESMSGQFFSLNMNRCSRIASFAMKVSSGSSMFARSNVLAANSRVHDAGRNCTHGLSRQASAKAAGASRRLHRSTRAMNCRIIGGHSLHPNDAMRRGGR